MPEKAPQDPIFKPLKAHLRFYKHWQGHRVIELANYCQVSRGTIYNWLKDKTKPKKGKLILIKEWLEKKVKKSFDRPNEVEL